MANNKKRVPLEIKTQILERIKNSGKTVKEIAAEHGVSTVTIYAWLSETVGEISKKKFLEIERENKQLKELLGEVTMKLSVTQKKV
jgi:transposase-like protein